MTVRFTERADKDYAALSATVRRAFGKQLVFLLENPRHPSLRAKKLEGHDDLWQARVNRSWRFYFKITGHEYAIIGIVPHPK
jgi:mRNA-degrading endonuclease RelE of RelBE toxin-antitoxin system